MKWDNYKITVVSIALVVPVIISIIYFVDLYYKNEKIQYIANLRLKPEIIYNTSAEIDGLVEHNVQVNQDITPYSFNVKYDGNVDNRFYTIKLTNIKINNNVSPENIRWTLIKQSRYNREEINGDFENINGEKILRSFTINPKEVHNIKFYYYSNVDIDDNTDDLSIRANLTID